MIMVVTQTIVLTLYLVKQLCTNDGVSRSPASVYWTELVHSVPLHFNVNGLNNLLLKLLYRGYVVNKVL